MSLPFTASEFFDVFARYNQAVWPAQWLVVALALLAMALVLGHAPGASRWASALLAVLWLWVGVVYHAGFFAAINPAAFLFALFSVAQAILLLWVGVHRGRVRFGFVATTRGLAGLALMAYAFVFYPLIGGLTGHSFPATPTFGAPCPTTIFTLGMLLWTDSRTPRRLFVWPLAWAAIGSIAALELGVVQDYGLLIAGLATLALLGAGRSRGVAKRMRPA